MAWNRIIWDVDDDPQGNVEHVVEHGLSKFDVEHILANPKQHGTSKSSGLPTIHGYTPDGQWAIVIYEEIDDDTIRPVTAYLL